MDFYGLSGVIEAMIARNDGAGCRSLRDVIWLAYCRVRYSEHDDEKANELYRRYKRLDDLIEEWDKEA